MIASDFEIVILSLLLVVVGMIGLAVVLAASLIVVALVQVTCLARRRIGRR